MLGEAMLNGSVTFLREAIRLLTLIVAPHAPPINLDPSSSRLRTAYSETRVARTSRNNARNCGCAGQAKPVTRLPSRVAPSGGVSTYSPPARRTSGAQAA